MPDVTVVIKPDGTVNLGRLAADIATEVRRTIAAHVPREKRLVFYELLMPAIEMGKSDDA